MDAIAYPCHTYLINYVSKKAPRSQNTATTTADLFFLTQLTDYISKYTHYVIFI